MVAVLRAYARQSEFNQESSINQKQSNERVLFSRRKIQRRGFRVLSCQFDGEYLPFNAGGVNMLAGTILCGAMFGCVACIYKLSINQ